MEEFVKVLERREIIQKSLDQFGYILVADTMEEAIETANEIASEHLEIVTRNPFEVMTKIRNAGAIFIGEYSCEPLGDYFAGPNHILPTNGTAKFFSPLSVDDFMKKSSIVYYSREALADIQQDIRKFARSEQLTATRIPSPCALRRKNNMEIIREKEQDGLRMVTVKRDTRETRITLSLNLDGTERLPWIRESDFSIICWKDLPGMDFSILN